MNISETLQLKFPNAKFGINGDIVLQDDGDGVVYIAHWNDSLGVKPDSAALSQWAIELAPVKQAQDARQNRRNEYPPIGDQLDMIYKAMESGELPKVNDFFTAIKAVKDKYPLVAK